MIPLRDDIPSSRVPVVNFTLLGACLLVFLWQLSLGPEGFERAVFSLGVIPATLLGDAELPAELRLIPPEATIFTSMFMHGGLLHLAGNLLYLWIFGDNVEDAMGHGRFLVFYFACGIVAALAQALPDPDSTIPMIGASGAISGVLGAYLLLYPRARVLVLIPLGFFSQIVHLPAIFVLGLWFLLQLVSSLFAEAGQGGVAFGAHIGGFIAGMALVPFFKRARVPLFGGPRRYY
ncbi:MAG TPA: rhomboid family intramembrane serine protease [Burkholderiales bacterium]